MRALDSSLLHKKKTRVGWCNRFYFMFHFCGIYVLQMGGLGLEIIIFVHAWFTSCIKFHIIRILKSWEYKDLLDFTCNTESR